MSAESMAGYNRYIAALSGKEMPDRVPVALSLDPDICCGILGDLPGVMHREGTELQYIKKVVDILGPWDGDMSLAMGFSRYPFFFPVKMMLPGFDGVPDDSPMIAHEDEYLKAEEYDQIIEEGWSKFVEDVLYERIYGVKRPPLIDVAESWAEDSAHCREWGMELITSNVNNWDHPFFDMSLSRSFMPFAKDLFYQPAKLEKVMEVMMDEIIEQATNVVKKTGCGMVAMTEERANAAHFPLKIFEKYWMPYTLKFVRAMHELGVPVKFHADQNWIQNVPYFLQFPKNSVCLEFDSTTPMAEARKILGDHVQLAGDVPASLLCYGTKDQVREYCQALIRDCGQKGGFILQAGCNVPMDAQIGNLEVMLDVARTHRY